MLLPPCRVLDLRGAPLMASAFNFLTLWHVSPVYLLQHGRPCHPGAAKPRWLCSSCAQNLHACASALHASQLAAASIMLARTMSSSFGPEKRSECSLCRCAT